MLRLCKHVKDDWDTTIMAYWIEIGKKAPAFTLTADDGKKVKFMGIQRSTYLIAADGKVAAVWPNVKVDGHDEQVLEALKNL